MQWPWPGLTLTQTTWPGVECTKQAHHTSHKVNRTMLFKIIDDLSTQNYTWNCWFWQLELFSLTLCYNFSFRCINILKIFEWCIPKTSFHVVPTHHVTCVIGKKSCDWYDSFIFSVPLFNMGIIMLGQWKYWVSLRILFSLYLQKLLNFFKFITWFNFQLIVWGCQLEK